MRASTKRIGTVAAILVAAAAVGAVGYFVGERSNATNAIPSNKVLSEQDVGKIANADLAKVNAQDGALPPPPLALPEMRKAVRLEDENPDAFRAQYLDRRYRVIGKVASIIGSTDREPRIEGEPVDVAGEVMAQDARSHNDNRGLIFRVSLEPWDLGLPQSTLIGPDLAFDDLPGSTRLAMRRGDRIDANCTLTHEQETFFFEHCKLNKTIQK